MGIMDLFKSAKDATMNGIKQITNKKYLDAVVAGCALVAAADGRIESNEKQKMLEYIKRNDALKVFDSNEITERFNHFADNFNFDAMVGKQTAMDAIAKIKGNKEESRMCVMLCISIGKSDGSFDANEVKVVKEICSSLALNFNDFQI